MRLRTLSLLALGVVFLASCGGGGGSGGAGSSAFTVPGRIVSDRFRECLEAQAALKGWRRNSDVRSIECVRDYRVTAYGTGVENLEGVQVFFNLEEIIIYSSGSYGLGQIDDLSPLKGLKRLHTIEMYTSALTDFESIRGKPSLRRLVVVPSRVNDLSALPSLPNLKHLNISGATIHARPIDDYSPLAQLSGLEELHLQAHYTLSQYGLSFLNGMQNLRLLNLAENFLRTADEIRSLPALEVLDLSYNNLFSDFDDTAVENMLGGLSSLKEFYYARFDGHSLEFLGGMTALEVLVITRYFSLSLADTTVIGSLTNLRELYLGGFVNADTSPLQGLSNLEILWLANGTVDSSTLAFPETMSSLRELHMLDAFSYTYNYGDRNGYFKSTYAVFEDLPALQTLNLDRPWLLDESGVTLNPNVRDLAMVEARLDSLEFLRDVPGIISLDLSDNPFTELDPLATMPDLIELTLNDTTVSCAEMDEFRTAAPEVSVVTDLYCPSSR